MSIQIPNWLYIIVFTCLFCSGSKIVTAQNINNYNPLFAYNLGGMQEMSPAEQINLLQGLGYDGICLQTRTQQQVENLSTFIALCDKNPSFHIESVFVRYNFKDPEDKKNTWKKVVDMIQGKDIDLWFIFGRETLPITYKEVQDILKGVAAYAQTKGVNVSVYPHSGCFFYAAEQALPAIKAIDAPNLRVIVHLFHELRAGNGNRMPEVINNVKDYMSYATLAGAEKEVDMTSAYTMDKTTIKSLDENEYDLAPFLNTLKEVQYKKPVGFINWKLDEDAVPKDYLSRTIKSWKTLKNKYLNHSI